MKIARRVMLGLMGATALTAAWPVGKLHAAPGVQPFFLIFDDISEDTPADALAALLSPFAMSGIPVGFIIKPDDTIGASMAGGGGVARLLRNFLRASPRLGELIVWVPDIASVPPYFQIRKASEAKARLEAFLGLTAGGTPFHSAPLTIAGDDRDDSPVMDAVRAAGFRNVMLLSQKAGPSGSDRCTQTMACMRGSQRHAITDETREIIMSINAMQGTDEMTVLALSVKDIADVPHEMLQTRAAALAITIGADVRANRIFAALPKDHVFWFGTGAERLIGLGIEVPTAGSPAAVSAFAALQAALAAAAIPFSLLSGTLNAEGIGQCQKDTIPSPAAPICATAEALPVTALGQLADAGGEVIVQPAGTGMVGMDENGVLHLPQSTFALDNEQRGDIADPSRDVVISIPPAAYTTAGGRTAILNTLAEMTKTSGAAILAIPDYAKAVLAKDPAYRLMLATRRDGVALRQAPPAVTEAERAALMEDARIAWGYFDRLTESTTGLSPSTVFIGEWSSINRTLTMWDFGSIIQATIAGHALGLIDDAQFLDRSKAILRSLPAEMIGGLVLPSSEIASDNAKSVTRDYNACDTGRLLIALAAMNTHPLSKGIFANAVAKWDLGATLRDGRLHSITQGKFQPFFVSQCAHYAARAFGLWGLMAASPYDAMQGQSITDARMNLLYAVAQIGAIGAEPLLLEAVELGLSEPSAYLTDVLFAAQARSFAVTGDLICASEGPMDRAPWFTYQGLKVNADQDIWDVQSIDPTPMYDTSDFRMTARVISTKAAFLWAVVRPGAYSSLLLDHVRQRARMSEVGYSSGIYSATGKPMANYSDINTNGVILQAIAYRLRVPA